MTRLYERRSAAATFAVPALLVVLTIVGLVAGLAGEGRLSVVAWVGTGMPVFVALAGLWSGRPPRRQQPSRSARSTRLAVAQSQSCR